mmetsp:Transcript_25175/g.51326  ORF Transcript_25175/g.51326 Transcript_25175/m.51326 type:complete len:476 (-) Transcript_25175:164-1591(-)
MARHDGRARLCLLASALPVASSFAPTGPLRPGAAGTVGRRGRRPSTSSSTTSRYVLPEQVEAIVAVREELLAAGISEKLGDAGAPDIEALHGELTAGIDASAELAYNDVGLLDGLPDGLVGEEAAAGTSGVGTFSYGDMMEAGATKSLFDRFLDTYLGPRALLAVGSLIYATNFPLVALLDESLPPSAATSARTALAGLALLPFLPKLDRSLTSAALAGGFCAGVAIISQAMSLVDTSPATVAFLGAATVIVCPALQFLFDGRPMSPRDAPQTWLAGLLCLTGVAALELYDPTGASSDPLSNVGWGDALALLQAVGFGGSFFLTERMMRGRSDQALPIASAQVGVVALMSAVWCAMDGWIGAPGTASYGLPGLFLDPGMRAAAVAVAWTGVVSTALNRGLEATALGKLSSSETSVILTLELLWVPMLSALWLSETMGINDYVGGFFIVAACLANGLKPSDFDKVFGKAEGGASSQ